MNPELITLALMVGAANWAFRVLPMKLQLPGAGGTGPVARTLAATGPAAIATLFVASVLPEVQVDGLSVPLVCGSLMVIGTFAAARSVALATVLGAVAYGAATAILT